MPQSSTSTTNTTSGGRPIWALRSTSAAFLALYLIAVIAALVLFNADAENRWIALALLAGASLVLGWTSRSWTAVIAAVVSIPFALPFGYADSYAGSDAPQVWWFAFVTAPISALLIAIGVGARKSVTGRQGSGAPHRHAG